MIISKYFLEFYDSFRLFPYIKRIYPLNRKGVIAFSKLLSPRKLPENREFGGFTVIFR